MTRSKTSGDDSSSSGSDSSRGSESHSGDSDSSEEEGRRRRKTSSASLRHDDHHHHHHHRPKHHVHQPVDKKRMPPPSLAKPEMKKRKKVVRFADEADDGDVVVKKEEDEVDETDDTSDGEEEEGESSVSATSTTEKRLHDGVVAQTALPIFFLITENAPVRSCGRCAGCKPCGKCRNCLRNAENKAEVQKKLDDALVAHPELAAHSVTRLAKMKIADVGKKKKRLKCSVAKCERVPQSAVENVKQLRETLVVLEKTRTALAIKLCNPGTEQQSETRKLFDATSKELETTRAKLAANRHGGLSKGHSYAFRLMKKIHKHFRSVANELVSRGDLDDTGAERRANRDLAIEFLIRIAEVNKRFLIGAASSEEWDRAIVKSRNFLTGGKLQVLDQYPAAATPKVTIVY